MKETCNLFGTYPQMNIVGVCLYSLNRWYAFYTHWNSNFGSKTIQFQSFLH